MKNFSFLKLIFSLTFCILFSFAAFAQTNGANPKTYRFINGSWFNGNTFKSQTFYSVNGVLTRRKPSKIDELVDLKNGFVIPPFADAHTHNLDGLRGLDKITQDYLAEGTFYVQVLANHATGAKQVRPFFNKPATLDVIYANGMLTCTHGHPFMVYEPLAMGIYNPMDGYKRIDEVKKSRLAENNAYWFLNNRDDVEAKWQDILATKPDIIKIGLLDAENYNRYVAANDTVDKGLSPEAAAYVVEKAHQAGLRVYAHVETANDFRLGLKIGVDGFAHAPYYDWNGRSESKPKDDLTAEDLKLAAEKGIVMIPTAKRSKFRVTDYADDGKETLDMERFQQVLERHKKLFNQMHRRGVKLALGLDIYAQTLIPEVLYFHDNKIFDNQTLLKIAVETTPQTIFPNRKIGRLRDGYEASFLVLNGNPLQDFTQIKNISLRFKQGSFINITHKAN